MQSNGDMTRLPLKNEKMAARKDFLSRGNGVLSGLDPHPLSFDPVEPWIAQSEAWRHYIHFARVRNWMFLQCNFTSIGGQRSIICSPLEGTSWLWRITRWSSIGAGKETGKSFLSKKYRFSRAFSMLVFALKCTVNDNNNHLDYKWLLTLTCHLQLNFFLLRNSGYRNAIEKNCSHLPKKYANSAIAWTIPSSKKTTAAFQRCGRVIAPNW